MPHILPRSAGKPVDLSRMFTCALLAVQLIGAPIEPRLALAAPIQQTVAQTDTTLKIEANLVPIRVVVRDSQGHPVGGLTKDDFQVLDEGKAEPLSQFFALKRDAGGANPETPEAPASPRTVRYTAYLFDDLHIDPSNFFQARDAATAHLATLGVTERAAIFTTSGQAGVDFTSDRQKLSQALSHIKPLQPSGPDCPRLSYYAADLIKNRNDADALNSAATVAAKCGFSGNRKGSNAPRQAAQAAAAEVVAIGRAQTEHSFRILKDLTQGMSKAPGQRTIVLISEGIFAEHYDSETEIIDLAVRGNVTVNVLDPAGLQPFSLNAAGAASAQLGNPVTGPTAGELNEFANWVVLSDLSDATGGTFFRNDNDLEEGFRRVAGTPEYSYVLAFSPERGALDGRFHKLQVKLTTAKSMKVQARSGYFAPKKK